MENVVIFLSIIFTLYFFWSVIKAQFYGSLQDKMDRLDGLDPKMENERRKFEAELERRRNLRNKQKDKNSSNENNNK